MSTTTLSPTGRARARRTTVFLKFLMALSGAFFVGFVLFHMYGNLKILRGTEEFDEYAHHLRTMLTPILPYGGMLWILRVALIVALFAHAYSAFALWIRANNARGTRYAARQAAKRTLRAKWMRWGGVAILLFLVWHLLQFTILKFNVGPDTVADSPGELVISSFQVWWVTLIYLLAMGALGMHLFHGVWSGAQTLGWANTARSRRAWHAIAHTLAFVIAVGFVVPPLLIFFGVVEG